MGQVSFYFLHVLLLIPPKWHRPCTLERNQQVQGRKKPEEGESTEQAGDFVDVKNCLGVVVVEDMEWKGRGGWCPVLNPFRG